VVCEKPSRKKLHHVSVLQRKRQFEFKIDAFLDEASISQIPEVHQLDGRLPPRHIDRLHFHGHHPDEILSGGKAQLLG
jgi:hypothetical protein